MGSNALAAIGPTSLIPAERELETMLRMADLFVKSGLMPNGVKTAAAAFTIMQTGHELRIGPMAAIRGIRVIQGKSEVSPNLAAALIHRDHDDEYGPALVPVESTHERATFRYKRRGERAYLEMTYTLEDAKRARLFVAQAADSTWVKYTRDMLVARDLGTIAKLHFQDTINGLSMWGEIEQEIAGRLVDFETGEAIEPPPPLVAVEGGHLDEATGEFTPLPEVDSPIGVASTQGTPAASPSAQEPDNLDDVAPHAYRQRLYTNSRELKHPAIHALALHMWPALTSVTAMTYRQVDQLLAWINTTPPDVFDPTLEAAIEAASDRVDEADIAAEQEAAPPAVLTPGRTTEAISEEEAQQLNWRDQIQAACAEPTNLQVWRDLVVQAGAEEWRWVELMGGAPSKEKLGSLHTYAGKAKALSDAVKAAHNRRLEALQARIDQHTS